jgi:hypothetical protein
MRVAIAFYGITRSLRYTYHSIYENVIEPLRSTSDVRVYGHFYNIKNIINVRSGELCEADSSEYKLIDFDSLLIEEPEECLDRFDLSNIFRAKDPYCDDFKSISNLLHQLNSLDKVTALIANKWEPDIVIFLRPDLIYHDSLFEAVSVIKDFSLNAIYLPRWQSWGGYNDRFAICTRKSYVAYGKRGCLVNEYIGFGKLLYSELFLRYALNKSKVNVYGLQLEASRVRADGRLVDEVFLSTGVFKNFFIRLKLLLKSI